MNTIAVLLVNYATTVLINTALSAYSYFSSKNRIYLYTVYFWIGSFINFVLQGIFQTSYIGMSLAFWSYVFAYAIELKILNLCTGITFPMLGYAIFNFFCLILGLVAAAVQNSFLWVALPLVTGLAGMMFHSAIYAVRHSSKLSNRREIKLFAIITIVHSLHLMDYPFLRMRDDFAPIGFSLGLILLITFSVFLPSFLLKSISDEYVRKLADINASQAATQKEMGDLMSLAQIGELSYSFVHDMASPTTLLMFYSNELAALYNKGLPQPDQLLPYSQGIEKATQRLMSLQKMFKSLINAEKAEKKLVPVDLSEVIRNCIELFGPFFRRNQINATGRITTTDPLIQSYSGVVDRILLNLIQNAVNALSGQTKEKNITLTLVEISPSEVAIRVEDSGPGISEDRLAHMWERFGPSETARLSGDTHANTRSGGSGFGLFKIKQLTEEIGGTITVQSTRGVGTIFEVHLPRLLKN